MREVKFRTIDRVFIRMSINDKMWVIFALFVTMLTALAVSRYFNTVGQIEHQSKVSVEQHLAGMMLSANPDSLSVSGLVKSPALSPTRYQNHQVTAVAGFCGHGNGTDDGLGS